MSAEYEDLIGTLPDEDPDDSYTIAERIEEFRRVPPNTQSLWLRMLLDREPELVLNTLFPGVDDLGRQTGAHGKLKDRLERDAADEAYRRLKGEAPPEKPSLVSLTDFLQEPDEDASYRVDGLWPTAGRVLLTAQFKAGKTTLVNNLVRSLVDGDPFLGRFATERAGRVVLIDNEMSPNQLRVWLRDQGIRKTDAVEVVSLRGKLSSFNILDPGVRAEWASLIGPGDVLIFDCLRPVLDALGLSEDKEAGRFLTALDELADAAGLSELVLVHHMGHRNERSRGDSRLLDWPDAIWKLVREDTDDAPERFFSAAGRDVDQPESRLSYDPATRHLRISGGSRRAATSSRIENAVQAHVGDNPGCSQGAIEKAVEGDNTTIRNAIRNLADEGWLRIEKQGPGRASLHYPDSPAAQEFSESGDDGAANSEK